MPSAGDDEKQAEAVEKPVIYDEWIAAQRKGADTPKEAPETTEEGKPSKEKHLGSQLSAAQALAVRDDAMEQPPAEDKPAEETKEARGGANGKGETSRGIAERRGAEGRRGKAEGMSAFDATCNDT